MRQRLNKHRNKISVRQSPSSRSIKQSPNKMSQKLVPCTLHILKRSPVLFSPKNPHQTKWNQILKVRRTFSQPIPPIKQKIFHKKMLLLLVLCLKVLTYQGCEGLIESFLVGDYLPRLCRKGALDKAFQDGRVS